MPPSQSVRRTSTSRKLLSLWVPSEAWLSSSCITSAASRRWQLALGSGKAAHHSGGDASSWPAACCCCCCCAVVVPPVPLFDDAMAEGLESSSRRMGDKVPRPNFVYLLG